jgi:hypothetical protein
MLKVGFSASRCIRDIAEGRVSIDSVVSITASTMCETKEQWIEVIDAYHAVPDYDQSSLAMCDHDKVIMVAHDLWDMGKIHQPRLVGAHRTRSPYVWMDLQHTSQDRENNPTLRKAWEQAQIIEALSSTSNSQESW